ncbi:MAG: cell division protein FtsI [Proteobacteria bacterium]|nr:cell division protein FtsI [Pseudomonadota bacterium]
MASDQRTADLRMDAANLYREEIVSDRGAGTIRVMTPVTRDGAVDPRRKTLYVGEAQILTPVGALPIAFEIAAESLGEAADQFAAGAQVAVEQAVSELQQMRREAASGLVIADQMPGGGRIQMP